jgi:anti-sigma-K factor RskA
LTVADKELLARYLLGDVSAEDRERLENAYLADDEIWESLTAVENDLIDAYVRGDLPERKKQQFEQHFLDSPEKYERLEMARLLLDPGVRQAIKAEAPQQQKRGWWRGSAESRWTGVPAWNLALIAATLIVAATVIFLTLQNRLLRTELGQLQNTQSVLQSQINQLQQQIATLSVTPKNDGSHEAPETVALLLLPDTVRYPGDNNSAALKIASTASSVTLMLQLRRDHYREYQATVETPEGAKVATLGPLNSEPGKTGGRIVTLHLSPKLLKKGDYIVDLSGHKPDGGTEPVDSYTFTASR